MQTYRDYRPDRRFQPTIALSPDGTQVAYSDNLSGQYNLVVAAIGESDASAPRRLTDSADATVRGVLWTADGKDLIFAADANGDEFNQVRRIASSGGQITSLTDLPEVQFALGDVSPDGLWVSYAGNDRDPKDQDVLVQALSTGEVRRVYADGGAVFAAGWSPDSTRLIAARTDSNTEIVLFLVGIDGSAAEQILPEKGEPAPFALPGPWLPDGSGFLVRTDVGRDFVGLARFDIETRELHWILTPEWDVEEVLLSKDGRVLVWTVNAGGISELHAAELNGTTIGADLPVPALPGGQISALSLSEDGGTIAALLVTGGRATNIVVADLGIDGRPAGEPRWLTDTLAGVTAETVEPVLVTFPTHDGRDVPAWLYRPAGEGPFPVVLSIHGGPEAQERPAYNYGGLYQFLVANGIAVLAPNVRGSNGYGRTYQRLVLRDWGGGDMGDFEAAAQYLQQADWTISERIGVFGGSYGGFATLTCLSRLPQYFACGVDIVGPSNLVTLTKSVPPTWRAMMADWVGDPDTEADFLLSRSPITYADQIVAPLFVIQGANDPRVNKAESDGIVEALRARGVEVRYDVYEDEGHGFTRKENEARAMGDSADFLIEHLKGAPAV
jgi:dipeptidyl aminopeptidase/acylaminoacyl peptidase